MASIIKDGASKVFEKGHISTEFTVWCGMCIRWYQEAAPGKMEAAKDFRLNGWKKTKARGWMCPDCSKKRDAK